MPVGWNEGAVAFSVVPLMGLLDGVVAAGAIFAIRMPLKSGEKPKFENDNG